MHLTYFFSTMFLKRNRNLKYFNFKIIKLKRIYLKANILFNKPNCYLY